MSLKPLPTELGSVSVRWFFAARLWSSFNPGLKDPFGMQLMCTILAPTPLLTANFVMLGKVIQRLGTQYSRLSPRAYMILFRTCDVILLVLQVFGGSLASSAVSHGTNLEKGGRIMLIGVAFQLVVITVYSLLGIEFFARYLIDAAIRTPGPKHTRVELTRDLECLIAALVFSTMRLFVRAEYRVIELEEGWGGRIFTTEVYFSTCSGVTALTVILINETNVLDGAMIMLAISTFNLFHPGKIFRTRELRYVGPAYSMKKSRYRQGP
ncbi:RTA1 like protein-domain-containing protein [Desarmillaria tabescens]|uniref:RTA1 like protein-domain-containing protein n=1 Tax=Armillaria tabescens TaxID=1929756 RepID=A0AA39KA62_ARMTA|nr:RTA1 like protein-domain-containing protein [Desarmillaria tabescens]KAK0457330.1 RTA1 like protein-domain-containing protein [Desarmillaria tabescens]